MYLNGRTDCEDVLGFLEYCRVHCGCDRILPRCTEFCDAPPKRSTVTWDYKERLVRFELDRSNKRGNFGAKDSRRSAKTRVWSKMAHTLVLMTSTPPYEWSYIVEFEAG
ncbi:hypothetical protein Y032_0331g2728 [Ancylostoma ceylanicum]|uniref:Uncharacterized protein n=1 Tax=Ancylostoma ceylanicum TaxID=53326 RepID=A0A016RZA6_9BILA|nr:hypothetical protein Y032_0331g2728 [Ancylostoma ceylanicum]